MVTLYRPVPVAWLRWCFFLNSTFCLANVPKPATPSVANTYSSVQAGIWNNASTWSGGKVPALNDLVVIRHVVTIEPGRAEQVFRVTYGAVGRLLFGANAQLRLGSGPCDAPITADPTTLLTLGTWQINEHRALYNNVASYYKRGATGNTINFDTSYRLTFNANGTGSNSTEGTPVAFTWAFANPEQTKLTITQQGVVSTWENIVFTPTSAIFTEISTDAGFGFLAQVRRGKL